LYVPFTSPLDQALPDEMCKSIFSMQKWNNIYIEQRDNITCCNFFCQTGALDFFFLMHIVQNLISSANLPTAGNIFVLVSL